MLFLVKNTHVFANQTFQTSAVDIFERQSDYISLNDILKITALEFLLKYQIKN
jgi:hypothetical protein